MCGMSGKSVPPTGVFSRSSKNYACN
jgi:hypothetical protein